MNVISAPFLLFLVFLVLKLCNVINWSWWFVAAPLWLVPVLFAAPFFIAMTLFFIKDVYVAIWKKLTS